MSEPLSPDSLRALYYEQRFSLQEVAKHLGCSVNKVIYWMEQYRFKRRARSEAGYIKHNPAGDPFSIRLPETVEERELFALAIGIYMGEGKKHDRHHVALANSDPAIHGIFLCFLETLCGFSRRKVSVWLNIFDDCLLEEAQYWWAERLGLGLEQFYESTIRPSRGGSYKKRSQYGTLTVAVNNVKLKQYIDKWCSEYYDRFSGVPHNFRPM